MKDAEPDSAHACRHSGGGHLFVRDENGVGFCRCGEMDLDPGLELDLIEIAHDAETAPLSPRAQRRSLVFKIGVCLEAVDADGFARDHGDLDSWVEAMLDAQETRRFGR